MKVFIMANPFNPWKGLDSFQTEFIKAGAHGACASFVGTMRDFNLGDDVESMYLDYYPEMTENLLTEYAQTMISQYNLLDLLLLHRVGKIYPNDSIVLVAAWSAHRAQAFDGCRQMMEYLKSKAPFGKKKRWKTTPNLDG